MVKFKDERRTEQIGIKVSPSEKKEILEDAQAVGEDTPSSFIRKLWRQWKESKKSLSDL